MNNEQIATQSDMLRSAAQTTVVPVKGGMDAEIALHVIGATVAGATVSSFLDTAEDRDALVAYVIAAYQEGKTFRVRALTWTLPAQGKGCWYSDPADGITYRRGASPSEQLVNLATYLQFRNPHRDRKWQVTVS